MTDTRARDALEEALESDGWAEIVLTYPFTPDQRRALAAAFLDVDVLAAAINTAQVKSLEMALGHDLMIPSRRILDALREPDHD